MREPEPSHTARDLALVSDSGDHPTRPLTLARPASRARTQHATEEGGEWIMRRGRAKAMDNEHGTCVLHADMPLCRSPVSVVPKKLEILVVYRPQLV